MLAADGKILFKNPPLDPPHRKTGSTNTAAPAAGPANVHLGQGLHAPIRPGGDTVERNGSMEVTL
jgi:hypothetical protein